MNVKMSGTSAENQSKNNTEPSGDQKYTRIKRKVKEEEADSLKSIAYQRHNPTLYF